MLQNARVTTFTVSDLLNENQKGVGASNYPLHTHTHTHTHTNTNTHIHTQIRVNAILFL